VNQLTTKAITACCGCSRGPAPTYPTKGRVVFADKSPLAGGNIEFAPQSGQIRTSARGVIGDDGTFVLTTFREGDGAIEGKHRVLIIPARRRGELPGKAARTLDGKYQDFATSGLEATVSADGPNDFEFVVTPAGGKR
jgi:hypothetical protein